MIMSLLQKVPGPKLQLIALLLLAIYPVAILASRLGLWDFKLSFLLFIAAAIIGFVVLVIAVLKMSTGSRHESKALVVTVLATLIPLSILGNSIAKGAGVPQIHDISTDLSNPPALTAAQADRIEGDHSVAYEGSELAKQQKDGYPALKGLTLNQAPADVFKKVRAVIDQNGWQVLAEDSETLPFTIEAVDTSLLFGFKDDVVVRISAVESDAAAEAAVTGSKVDVRSMSRVGKSDLGANAKRIQALLNQL
jgi:uncharacterized protein (DUF1499 family)